VRAFKLLFIFLSLILTGCNKNTSDSLIIQEKETGKLLILKQQGLKSPIELDNNQLIEKINLLEQSQNKSNQFLLLIYSPSCPTCKKLKTYLDLLITKEHYLIYEIKYNEYKLAKSKYTENTKYFINIQAYPTFLYYKYDNKLDIIKVYMILKLYLH